MHYYIISNSLFSEYLRSTFKQRYSKRCYCWIIILKNPYFPVISILFSPSCTLNSQLQYFLEQLTATQNLIRLYRLQQGFPNAWWDTCYNIACLNPLDSLQRLLGLWRIMLMLGSQCASGNYEAGCEDECSMISSTENLSGYLSRQDSFVQEGRGQNVWIPVHR